MALDTLPDDVFQQVIEASTDRFDVPLFDDVKGLGCLSKSMQQQLHRLRPLVGVRNPALVGRAASSVEAEVPLAVVKRPASGPWHVELLYKGKLVEAVVQQARHRDRRVRSIDVGQLEHHPSHELGHGWAPGLALRVVPELLGAGCSLLDLTLDGVKLGGSWADTFGEAAVCSARLRKLSLWHCRLRGTLPELRLPALKTLCLNDNQLVGGLEPLRGCTALQSLNVSNNQLTGGLEPLRGCTSLKCLDLTHNQMTGVLEPLRCCTVLRALCLTHNQLRGGLEPLRCCPALEVLHLNHNQLTGGLDALRRFTKMRTLHLFNNQLTGGLEPLRDCKALRDLELYHNQLSGGLEPLRRCTALEVLYITHCSLTGSLEPLRACTALEELYLTQNQLTGGLAPLRGCKMLEGLGLSHNLLTGSLEPLRGCVALQEFNVSNNPLQGEPLQGRTLELLQLSDHALVSMDEDRVPTPVGEQGAASNTLS